MKLTTAQKLLLALNILIILGFGAYYIKSLNYEFMAYVATIALVIGLLYGTLKLTNFPTYIITGVTLWGLLHMLGGSVQTVDGVLYAYKIFPFFDGGGDFYILKYDQVVHAFLYGVVGLMFLHLLQSVIGVKTHSGLIATIAIFAAAGFSILNEVVEFWAAVNIPGNGVGGYHNTVLDMIFNLTGAALAVVSYQLLKNKNTL